MPPTALYQCGVWVVGCKCMEFVATGWRIVKKLRLNQTIGNLSYGDLEIPLLLIRLGVTGLRKTGLEFLLD